MLIRGRNSGGGFIFYRRKEKVSEHIECVRNLARQSDLEGRGKKGEGEGERQNKKRREAEPWNGLHSFCSKIERSQEHSRHLAK